MSLLSLYSEIKNQFNIVESLKSDSNGCQTFAFTSEDDYCKITDMCGMIIVENKLRSEEQFFNGENLIYDFNQYWNNK